jgi:hypothetical protein
MWHRPSECSLQKKAIRFSSFFRTSVRLSFVLFRSFGRLSMQVARRAAFTLVTLIHLPEYSLQ